MANRRFNTQVTNRRGAMGGGMMKRSMYSKGTNGKKRIVAKEGGKMMKRKMFASGKSPFDKPKTTLKDPFTDPMMKILEEMKKLSYERMKKQAKDLPKKK